MQTIAEIINYLQQYIADTDIMLYPPASDAEIENAERILGIILPDDIKQFYQFANGFESEEDMFRIVPLEEMIWRKITYSENNLLYIAEYMVYCDMWSLEINPEDHNDYAISKETILTKHFAEFLQRFIQSGVFENDGLYDWAADKANNI